MKPLLIEVFKSDTGDGTYHASIIDKYNKLSAFGVGKSYREAVNKAFDAYDKKLELIDA